MVPSGVSWCSTLGFQGDEPRTQRWPTAANEGAGQMQLMTASWGLRVLGLGIWEVRSCDRCVCVGFYWYLKLLGSEFSAVISGQAACPADFLAEFMCSFCSESSQNSCIHHFTGWRRNRTNIRLRGQLTSLRAMTSAKSADSLPTKPKETQLTQYYTVFDKAPLKSCLVPDYAS